MGRKEYLFAYGTLRRRYLSDDDRRDAGLADKWRKKISGDMEFIGKGKIGAALYDLGSYPGAVREKDGAEIAGDVFWLSAPEKVLTILDRYEGYRAKSPAASEFVRRKCRVMMLSGKTILAWVYWYNSDPGDKKRIRHKDYLNYLKTKI